MTRLFYAGHFHGIVLLVSTRGALHWHMQSPRNLTRESWLRQQRRAAANSRGAICRNCLRGYACKFHKHAQGIRPKGFRPFKSVEVRT